VTVAQAFAAAGGDKSAHLMRWPRVLDGLFSATHAFANDRTDRSGKFNCLVAGRSKPGQRIIGLARQDIRGRADPPVHLPDRGCVGLLGQDPWDFCLGKAF
jgi:hypothetical protein